MPQPTRLSTYSFLMLLPCRIKVFLRTRGGQGAISFQGKKGRAGDSTDFFAVRTSISRNSSLSSSPPPSA